MAEVLYVPFGYLYLSEPPTLEMPLADFRTSEGQDALNPSPDFLDLLHDVMGKQQWFRDYREAVGLEVLPFVGRFSTKDPAESVADVIRAAVDVDGARARAGNWEGFLRELARNAERAGIMVLRSGVVGNNNYRPLDIQEFRGFSISDYIAPLIFVNGRDYRGSQIFTLAHEMAHIWAGHGGVSNPDYGLRSERSDSAVDQFCNRVAAETLVPGEDFQSRWAPQSSKLEDNMKTLTRHYRVSAMVILRQAHDYNLIPTALYREMFGRLVERVSAGEPAGESSGNFYYTLTARNGSAFTEAVVSSAAAGELPSREAADILGVKIRTLPAIAEHLFGSTLSLD